MRLAADQRPRQLRLHSTNDPPAAMRYTECRLQALSSDSLLQDIESENRRFCRQLRWFPAGAHRSALPATPAAAEPLFRHCRGHGHQHSPPHNPGELIDGVIALIENPAISTAELMQLIPGPDFPTGGANFGSQRHPGCLHYRAWFRHHAGGRQQVETVEQTGAAPTGKPSSSPSLPYQTNKAGHGLSALLRW